MLHQFSFKNTENPHHIFNEALASNKDQAFILTPTHVNQVIKIHEEFQDRRDRHLTRSQIWRGEKAKAERPQMFTSGIVAAAVIPGTRQPTLYGEKYDRVSIQPSWLTGKLIIVKEETHIDNIQNKVIFLGQPTDVAQAKHYLIKALLDEHFVHHSPKTVNLFLSRDQEAATEFLNTQFENLFTREQPPLFHVEHGVQGDEKDPIETWKLVRLAPTPQSEFEQTALANLRVKITSSPNVRMYLQTMKEIDELEKTKSPTP